MHTIKLLTGLIVFLLGACQPEKPRSSDMIAESFVDLQTHFTAPHATFRPVPLWVWNGTVTKAFIDTSLTDLKAHGFGGVFIHSRYGMTNDYLSDEWFDLCSYAVAKTRQSGMEAWLYDENWCPSGFAGGHVPATMPESYNQAMSLREVTLDRLTKENLNNYVAIFQLTGNEYLNITGKVNDYFQNNGKATDYMDDAGVFLAYEQVFIETGVPMHAGFSYVDLLVPGVTEHFLKVTVEEGYKPVVGDEFGKTIIGSFTDEPHIAPVGRNSFRWTPDLFDRFSECYGYKLEDHLPAIRNNVGDFKRVRHNYYQILLQLFIDRWAKPSYDYYQANNLEFAGHYWEHCWPVPYYGGDNMAMAAWHHRPTIDLLFNQMDEELPVQFGDVRNVKEVSSVANQTGRSRTLSETYGASGWDLTFDDMKRLGDWEYVLGINTMTQHLIYQSFLGCRKHDFPQSFSYHAPYWDQYTRLNDYFGRLSYALSAGRQTNDIVVFEPTTTAWLHYRGGGERERRNNPSLDKIDRSFRELLNGLEAKQIEYDLASENIVKDIGSVHGKQFVIGRCAYHTVILPEYMETLDQSTADLLSRFLKNGGEVLVVGEKPAFIDGVTSVYGDEWTKARRHDNNTSLIGRLQNAIMKFDALHAGDGRFYHLRRKLNDGQLLFFANSSKEEKAFASISMKGKTILRMDAMDGSIKKYPCLQQKGDISFQFELEPSGSILLFVSGKELTYPRRCEERSNPVSPNDEIRISLAAPNVMAIDYLTLKLDGKTYADQNTTVVTEILFKARGSAMGTPWFNAVHYKQTLADLNKPYDEQPGFRAEYKFTISDDFDYSDIKGVLELPYPATVSINGHAVTPIPNDYYLDREFKTFAIGSYLQKGENTLAIDASRMHILAELEPAFIIGNFTVHPATKGFSLYAPVSLQLGSWKTQGYPFYPDAVTYTATYTVADVDAGYMVKLDEWHGVVAEVSVNGEPAGIIGWRPYTLDISPWIKVGENDITVKVIGSLFNLIGPFNRPPQGIATPWSWRYQPPYRSGTAYYQIDYGLFTPFSVFFKGT